MELDDFKNDLESVNSETTKPNILTSKFISEMTQRKYQSKIKKIKYPELIGGLVCFLGLIFIWISFYKLDTLLLQIIAAITIILLAIIPFLSFLSLTVFNSVNDFDKPHIAVIKQFAIQKLHFLRYQKINAFLNYLLLVAVIVLLPKFIYGKDITINKSFWLFAFSFGYLFLLFFSKWAKKFYAGSLSQAEKLLNEIEP